MTIMVEHFRRIQEKLLQEFEVAKTSGHPGIKGAAREIFVKTFLRDHLSQRTRIESGEIIDSRGSRSGQCDIILYRDDIPALNIAPDHDVFLIEGVIATVEVKSNLDSAEIESALEAIRKIKALQRSSPAVQISIGRGGPPTLYTYIYGYDGANLDTLVGRLPQNGEEQPDMICILRKGIIVRNNGRLFPQDQSRGPSIVEQMTKDNMLCFFLHLLNSTAGYSFLRYNFTSYAEGHRTE